MRVRSERSEPFCQVIGKGSRHANWPGAETCLALAWQQSCGPVERPVLGVTRWLLHWGWLPGGISSVWSLGCSDWDSTAAAVPQEYRTPVWPTAPVLVPRTEGSSDPPRCRGLGQHFDADIANGKTSLPVWPELLHDLCERARCRFCLLVCFVLLFLLAFLFFYLLFLLAFLFLLFFVCFGCFSFLVILAGFSFLVILCLLWLLFFSCYSCWLFFSCFSCWLFFSSICFSCLTHFRIYNSFDFAFFKNNCDCIVL